MKARVYNAWKWAFVALGAHLLFHLFPDLIVTIPKSFTFGRELIGSFSIVFQYLGLFYELPLLGLQYLIRYTPEYFSIKYIVFNYLIGSMFYFILGGFCGYVWQNRHVRSGS